MNEFIRYYFLGIGGIGMAIQDALNSPLLNTSDVSGARKVLLSLYCSHDGEECTIHPDRGFDNIRRV